MLRRAYERAKLRASRRKVARRREQISPHLNLTEFHCHDGTEVPRICEPAVRRLAREVIEPLRKRFGPVTVMSGYRTRRYNNSISGAASNSQHIYDEHPESCAADLIFEKGSPRSWAGMADGLLEGRGGIGIYSSQGFVHVDSRREMARWAG